ncbi:MAG: protein translocase subunit SecD [Actinomycetales bacterium]|nr:protein translocase subunit SecD [Actinomycetales bacterium]
MVAGALALALTTPVRLGLDLRGGTQIVLETQDGPDVTANAESTDRALEVLRRRVDALGVSEPTLARSGERRIIIELPGVQDPKEAAEVIGKTAQLTFHPVLGVEAPETTPTEDAEEPKTTPTEDAEGPKATPTAKTTGTDEGTGDGEQTGRQDSGGDKADGVATDRERVIEDETGQPIRIGPSALTGEVVDDAAAQTDPQQGLGWFVTVDFRGSGSNAWKKLTAEAACSPDGDPRRRVAIVLDEQVISSPQVHTSVACNVGITGGSTQITGDFTDEEAKELAVLIRGGALPVPVEVVEQRTVGPTLGEEAIDASTQAAIIGLILTALFITIVYRLVGFVATIALGTYTLIAYGALLAVGATLTLPGLAGFVLAIGLAIDANVLVFERAREEYVGTGQRGAESRLHGALTAGFTRAWSAILDSNVTTLLAAGLLFFLAAGPVKGFGVTLGIGVLASMVSALIVTRVLAEFVLRRRLVQRHPAITGISGIGRVRTWLNTSGPDLTRRFGLFLVISGVVTVLAFTGIAVRGLNLGVEFTGGRLLQYSTAGTIDAEAARAAVGDAGFPEAVVQTSRDEDGGDEITVRTRPLTNEQAEEIQKTLTRVAPGLEKERDELLSPSMGDELTRKALIALAVALAAQLLYLAIRFRWTMGLGAVLSMFHDVVVVVGLFAWLGRPIDGVFLAAALTIIGLSVNDSVVVFDRIREIRRMRAKDSFAKVSSDAVLQTLPRTINTGLGAMAILAALTLLGGDSLTNISLALLVGLVVGTWSTVATAVPLASWFENRYPQVTHAPVRGPVKARGARL